MTKTLRQMGGGSLTTRASWLMVGKTLAFVLSFLLPLVVVRRLSQSEFGLYKQAFLVVGTAIQVLPFGFAMSAYYFLPRERERQGAIIFNILLFNAVTGFVGCVALVLYPGLLVRIFNGTELLGYAPVIGFVLVLWMTSSFLETVAVAHQETVLATIFIVAAQLSKTSLLIGAAITFGTVEALIYAAVVQGGLQTIILILYLRSRFKRFWRGFDWSILRMQLAYALPLGMSGMLFSLQNDLHNYFVSNQFGVVNFAIYSIGCFQLPLVGILGESVGSVMIPRVSLLQKHDETREITLLTARVMRKLAAVHFPLYVFLLVTGHEFITFLFTKAYAASWPIFAINITLIPVYVIVTDPVMRAYAAQRFFLLRVKVAIFTMLFLTLWFGTARLGLVGVITLVVGANIVERVITGMRVIRVLGVTRQDLVLFRGLGKLAAASVIAGAAAFVVRGLVLEKGSFLVLAACGVTLSLTYLTAILVLNVPTADERQLLQRKMSDFFAYWKRPRPAAASKR